MSEWFKEPVLKTGVRESVPWVRIPPHLPFTSEINDLKRFLSRCHTLTFLCVVISFDRSFFF
ncbi:hypothetical protein AGR6A_Cc80127 [Agrobacterium sp. NCPPB 925]|nr:hypothetical protein AGR6A_Cc80127 [Agrobacterium sp. NCPPB 925]